MARFEQQKKFLDIVEGNRTEVCMRCAQKAGKRHIEARRTDAGKLTGKPVFRIDTERTFCLSCLKEMIEAYEADVAKKQESYLTQSEEPSNEGQDA